MVGDLIKVFGCILGIVLGLMLLAVFVSDSWARYTCANFENVTGKNTRYVAFDVCYIKHDGEWMRYPDYQKTLIARDALSQEGEE